MIHRGTVANPTRRGLAPFSLVLLQVRLGQNDVVPGLWLLVHSGYDISEDEEDQVA